MAVEVEAKIKVDSHDAVRERLTGLGAERLGRVRETNHIFDNADRTLLARGCGLRIRVCVAEKGAAPPATMTYKGPVKPGPLKQREEIQIVLDNAAAGRTLLERLGFIEAVRFEKRRESWCLHNCQIELDEVPYLGRYVEIEGPDGQSIRHTQEALGLAAHDTIRRSYIALLIEYCQQHSLPADRITFPPAGG